MNTVLHSHAAKKWHQSISNILPYVVSKLHGYQPSQRNHEHHHLNHLKIRVNIIEDEDNYHPMRKPVK